MNKKDSIIELLKNLWLHVTPKRKLQLFFLIVLMVIASFAEVISLGALLPFLGMITSPENVLIQPNFQIFVKFFDIHSAADLSIPVTAIFCFAVVISGALRMALLWATTKISYRLGADLSMSTYRRTIYQPYLTHISRNSSELVAILSTKVSGVILTVIHPILIAISSTIILLSILIFLTFLNLKVSVIAFFSFTIIYFFIIKASNSKLSANSKLISVETTSVVKSIQEALGGIRQVLLDGAQEIYCSDYKKSDNDLRKAQASNYFIANSPRFIIESAGMVLIAVIALYLTQSDNNPGTTIITLGIFGLGAQRLLPVLQQIYHSLTSISGNKSALFDVVSLLNQPLPIKINLNLKKYKHLRFNKDIVLSGVFFRYSKNNPDVLKNINLTIRKGMRIGFIGPTGSGKSTLIDIIIGLLNPTKGALLIDGKNISNENVRFWQNKIAHVPQTIHLIDASIAENIAFGEKVDAINLQRVKKAAKNAQIDLVIESLPLGYQTIVGERGIRFSGGQKQRIAIARALYKRSNIIVFDEATSALDGETEASLMNAIGELSSHLTILIIAHRLSTLKKCDAIVNVTNGKIKRIGTYSELVRSNR
jgi:ABC-type multidrug transport system fused ATPase/permease subunit